MITYDNGVFALLTEELGCLLRVTPRGALELVHFGARVDAADAAALAARPGMGWGCALQADEDDAATCPDIMPLAWSGCGRGDYRESPVELERGGEALSTDFVYVSRRVLPGDAAMAGALPQARGAAETLELTLREERHALGLRLYFSLFGGVMTRRAVLVNEGKVPVTLRRLMSGCMDLPGRYEMLTLDGGWIRETHIHRCAVGPARVVNESTAGCSSARHNPGFLLCEPDAGEDNGRVFGFNLVYSGNHYAAAQRSAQGYTRVVQGVSPANFARVLGPGESFETPEAVLAFSDAGLNGLSARMHEFVNRHIVPEHWRGRERPVLYNSWEGCMFDFSLRSLTDLAKRAGKLGCELFVLDDGWFGARDSDRAGLGDYAVNTKKLPGGLELLAAKLRAQGLDFGLWFEPEAVNPDSELYRAHPDWALAEAGRPLLLGRHELLLDLTKSEVRDYIVASVSAVLDSADIRYVKWDMNRPSEALGSRAHDYILGLYDVLRRIFGPRPEILLEGCASGGSRFDLGILCHAPQIWCSDDTDPVERLDIQKGLSLLYPLSTMGAHVSAAPHAQTLRHTPLATRANVAFFGVLGYELDLRQLLPVEETEIAAQIAFYKAHRKTFQFGAFRRLPREEDGERWLIEGEGERIAGVFHRLAHAAPETERLRIPGLPPRRRYRLTSRPQALRVGDFGALLRHVTPVTLDPNGLVVRTADRRYRMMDGQQSCEASGAALAAGVTLAPRFAGTGYDKDGRMQGDFGSSVYVLRELEQTGKEDK